MDLLVVPSFRFREVSLSACCVWIIRVGQTIHQGWVCEDDMTTLFWILMHIQREEETERNNPFACAVYFTQLASAAG